MLRQLKTRSFRQHVASSAGLKALVVGNPDLGGWEGYSDLPGAREEAQQVAQTLRKVG